MRFRETFSVIAIVCATAASVSAGPLVTNGLSLYYSFDAVGTTVSDGSGNGYDGSVVGNVVQAASGVVGGAAQFWTEGVDIPDYFDLDHPENADYNYIDLPVSDIATGGDIPTSGFTVALWYNTKAYLDDVEGEVTRHWANQSILGPVSSDDTWVLHGELRSRDDATSDFYRFTARGATSTKIGEIQAGNGTAEGPDWETWTHLAMTYDKASSTMMIYENGVMIDSLTSVDNAIDMCADWSKGAFIGCTCNPGDYASRQFFGSMDEFYVFNRALGVSEINTLVEGPAAGDANCDGKVDGSDVTILAGNWQVGVDGIQRATWDMGDFNGDGKIDGSDVTILAGNWQHGVTTAAASVPEPSTIVLLLGALVALATIRRLKK